MTRKAKNIHKPRQSKKSANVPTLKLEPKPSPVEARVAALNKETEPEIRVPSVELPHVFQAYQEAPTVPAPDANVWVPKMEVPREFKAVDGSIAFE